jgi:hypothetical protein
MADYKVTELNEILGASVAADDVALLVDVSANEDKKIKVEELAKAVGSNLPASTLDGSAIADDSIDGDSKLIDGSVTGPKLAANSVDRTHVIANEISGSATTRGKVHLEPGSIAAADIADFSITPDKLAGGSGLPPGGIIDADIALNAEIQVSKLEPVLPNNFLAGPSAGAIPGTVTARPIESFDLPTGSDIQLGAVSVPSGSGLTATNGAISHASTVFGQNLGFIEYNDTGHILNARAIDASIDLPPATNGSLGVVQIGNGLDVDFSGLLSLKPATTFTLGGVIVGSDFNVDFSGTIGLNPTGVTAGQYTKVTVDDKGRVTQGETVTASDINGGTLDPNLIADNSINGIKLADYATCYMQEGSPGIGDFLGQFWWQPSTSQLRVYVRGSAGTEWANVGFGNISGNNLRWGGTFDATTDKVTSVTDAGLSDGLAANTAFPAPSDALAGLYLLCETGGAAVSQPNLTGITFNVGDWAVCNGAAGGWTRIAAGSGGGGGGGASRLNDLLDVQIGSISPQDLLEYDAGSALWKNTSLVDGGTF